MLFSFSQKFCRHWCWSLETNILATTTKKKEDLMSCYLTAIATASAWLLAYSSKQWKRHCCRSLDTFFISPFFFIISVVRNKWLGCLRGNVQLHLQMCNVGVLIQTEAVRTHRLDVWGVFFFCLFKDSSCKEHQTIFVLFIILFG